MNSLPTVKLLSFLGFLYSLFHIQIEYVIHFCILYKEQFWIIFYNYVTLKCNSFEHLMMPELLVMRGECRWSEWGVVNGDILLGIKAEWTAVLADTTYCRCPLNSETGTVQVAPQHKSTSAVMSGKRGQNYLFFFFYAFCSMWLLKNVSGNSTCLPSCLHYKWTCPWKSLFSTCCKLVIRQGSSKGQRDGSGLWKKTFTICSGRSYLITYSLEDLAA